MGTKGRHVVRDGRLKLKRRRPRVRNISDDERRQTGQSFYGFRNVL
jgi:hypothetical protein